MDLLSFVSDNFWRLLITLIIVFFVLVIMIKGRDKVRKKKKETQEEVNEDIKEEVVEEVEEKEEVPKEDPKDLFELPQHKELSDLKDREVEIDNKYIEVESEIKNLHKKTETIVGELDSISEDIELMVNRLKNIYVGVQEKKIKLSNYLPKGD